MSVDAIFFSSNHYDGRLNSAREEYHVQMKEHPAQADEKKK
jgi:hypothetical protein